jgi:hypothetical protein
MQASQEGPETPSKEAAHALIVENLSPIIHKADAGGRSRQEELPAQGKSSNHADDVNGNSEAPASASVSADAPVASSSPSSPSSSSTVNKSPSSSSSSSTLTLTPPTASFLTPATVYTVLTLTPADVRTDAHVNGARTEAADDNNAAANVSVSVINKTADDSKLLSPSAHQRNNNSTVYPSGSSSSSRHTSHDESTDVETPMFNLSGILRSHEQQKAGAEAKGNTLEALAEHAHNRGDADDGLEEGIEDPEVAMLAELGVQTGKKESSVTGDPKALAAIEELQTEVVYYKKRWEKAVRDMTKQKNDALLKMKSKFGEWAEGKKKDFLRVQEQLKQQQAKTKHFENLARGYWKNASELKAGLDKANSIVKQQQEQIRKLMEDQRALKHSLLSEEEKAKATQAEQEKERSEQEAKLQETLTQLDSANSAINSFQDAETIKQGLRVAILNPAGARKRVVTGAILGLKISFDGAQGSLHTGRALEFKIQWFRSHRGSLFAPVQGSLGCAQKYKPTADDIGCVLRAEVTAMEGMTFEAEIGPVYPNGNLLEALDRYLGKKEHTFPILSITDPGTPRQLVVHRDKVKLRCKKKTEMKAVLSEHTKVFLSCDSSDRLDVQLDEKAIRITYDASGWQARDEIALTIRMFLFIHAKKENRFQDNVAALIFWLFEANAKVHAHISADTSSIQALREGGAVSEAKGGDMSRLGEHSRRNSYSVSKANSTPSLFSLPTPSQSARSSPLHTPRQSMSNINVSAITGGDSTPANHTHRRVSSPSFLKPSASETNVLVDSPAASSIVANTRDHKTRVQTAAATPTPDPVAQPQQPHQQQQQQPKPAEQKSLSAQELAALQYSSGKARDGLSASSDEEDEKKVMAIHVVLREEPIEKADKETVAAIARKSFMALPKKSGSNRRQSSRLSVMQASKDHKGGKKHKKHKKKHKVHQEKNDEIAPVNVVPVKAPDNFTVMKEEVNHQEFAMDDSSDEQ